MSEALLKSLTIVGPGGYAIIAAIFVLLALGVVVTLSVCGRYALLERELRGDADPDRPFRSRVLGRIAQEAREARSRGAREINTQAIIEHAFQRELGGLLLGERFVKAATGLMIILGLVGTFYGLTISIGRLVALVSGDAAGVADLTQSVTRGLTQTLSGMSVAFSTSLVGIGAAIVMTLVGVFLNVPDRRNATMVKIEHFVDNVLLPPREGDGDDAVAGAGDPLGLRRLEPLVARFGQSVVQLERAVASFDGALQGFATTTRDFREFNLHLKDNVQRMSLSFGDLSEALKAQVATLTERGRS